jgi:hypothetical protein
MTLKNSNDIIGNRTRDLPVCSVVLNHYATAHPRLNIYQVINHKVVLYLTVSDGALDKQLFILDMLFLFVFQLAIQKFKD